MRIKNLLPPPGLTQSIFIAKENKRRGWEEKGTSSPG